MKFKKNILYILTIYVQGFKYVILLNGSDSVQSINNGSSHEQEA